MAFGHLNESMAVTINDETINDDRGRQATPSIAFLLGELGSFRRGRIQLEPIANSQDGLSAVTATPNPILIKSSSANVRLEHTS